MRIEERREERNDYEYGLVRFKNAGWFGERTRDERNGGFGHECTSLVLRGNLFAFCVDRLQSDEETEFAFGTPANL